MRAKSTELDFTMNNLKYLNASRNIYREYEDDIGQFDLDQSSSSSSFNRPQETSSLLPCDTSKLNAKDDSSSRNVNLFLVDYLNKEFISLGFEAFLSQSFHAYFSNNLTSPTRESSVRLFDVVSSPADSADQHKAVAELINSNALVANALKLVERYKINLRQYEEEKEKCHRLNRENELFHKRQINLKETNEASNKDYILIEEKLKQYEVKFNTLSKAHKETTDENKRLNNLIEQRDKQFKHDRKKFETELNRLKDRIKTLTNPKSVIKEFSNMEISDLVRQNSSGGRYSSSPLSSSSQTSSRGSWSNNCDALIKKQMEMYSDLIRDYESKTRELIAEQNELKQFLNHFYLNMCVVNRNLVETLGGYQTDGGSSSSSSPTNSTNEDSSVDYSQAILSQPFENVYFKLNKLFQQQFNQINRLIAKKSN